MILVLVESVFEAGDDIDLVGIVGAARARRHTIRTRPSFRRDANQAVNRWLGRQSQKLRDEFVQVLQEGLKEPEYAGHDQEALRVMVEPRDSPDLAVTPPILPLRVAHELALQPLHVLLENGRSDWGFLRKIAPKEWRDRLHRAVDKGWVEERNAGGITELPKILRQDLVAGRETRLGLRTWAMFDSDARQPECPSEQSEAAIRACADAGVPFRRLSRRSIENYLPRESLLDWAARVSPREKRSSAKQRVLAYFQMSAEQRHHYSLKDGFDKDKSSVWKCPGDPKARKGLSAIYSDLRDELRSTLAVGMNDGFKTEVSDVWRSEDYDVNQAALSTEGFDDERHAIFQSLFGRL